ncbi:MAG: mechanosensitive ion channel [Alphaproteobacteria bacterium]|nr:mechanosensitive ion channel [Alphaproteobacteria bacterium]
MEFSLNIDKFLESITKTLTSASLYWQSLSIILCFVFAYFFYSTIRNSIIIKILNSPNNSREFNNVFKKYFLPLLFPVISLFFLILGYFIYQQFYKETIVISTTIKLIALFLFLRMVRITSNSTFITNASGVFLVPALILHIFGALEPTISYLDELYFKIGKIKISLYLIIKAIIVLLTVFWLSGLISRKSKSYFENNKNIKSSTKGIISKFIDIIIYSVVFIIILKTFGVDLTALAVIGGAIGVGIGFGLQKIASNFISGIILLFEKSVEVGDIIELDNGSIYGTIKHFGGRYTLVEAMDGKEIMIPNEEFIIGKVTNWTYSNNRARIEIKIGVAYDSDLKKAKELMLQCALEHKKCIKYPEPECYVSNLNEYDITMILYFWINDIVEGRMGAKSDVMVNIFDKFKENNIKIPLPQRELKIIEEIVKPKKNIENTKNPKDKLQNAIKNNRDLTFDL